MLCPVLSVRCMLSCLPCVLLMEGAEPASCQQPGYELVELLHAPTLNQQRPATITYCNLLQGYQASPITDWIAITYTGNDTRTVHVCPTNFVPKAVHCST
eukprot:GHUV01040484.1.p2 GENE.GHUV01040484.1~~GHUV01040484.1.p2  ORF type:complete len:100 (+),score=13.68 GHUV01040484.1:777-1076(+)